MADISQATLVLMGTVADDGNDVCLMSSFILARLKFGLTTWSTAVLSGEFALVLVGRESRAAPERTPEGNGFLLWRRSCGLSSAV